MSLNLAVLVLALLADPVTGFIISPSYHATAARGGSVGLASTTAYPTLESTTKTPAQKSAQTQTRSLSLSKPLGLVLAEESTGSLGAIVKDVKAGGSAAANGVAPGERLLTVNGADVTQLPFGDVVQAMVSAQGAVEMSFEPREGGSGVSSAAKLKASKLSAEFEASIALPWAQSPPALAKDASRGNVGSAGGALAGNRGFDPLGLGRDRKRLLTLREAEIKHARLAMVAALGWPAAELGDESAARLLGLPAVLSHTGGLNPSLLNGGLLDAAPLPFWLGCVAFTAYVEAAGNARKSAATVTNAPYLPGDLGFDPLGCYPKQPQQRGDRQESELRHGRLAMLAVAGFAGQEAVTRQPVASVHAIDDFGAALTGTVEKVLTQLHSALPF